MDASGSNSPDPEVETGRTQVPVDKSIPATHLPPVLNELAKQTNSIERAPILTKQYGLYPQ
jgi:hypothetical protein